MPVGRLMQKGPRKRHLAAEACTTTDRPPENVSGFFWVPPPPRPRICSSYFAYKYHKATVHHVKRNKIQILMTKIEFYFGSLKERNNSWLTHFLSTGTSVSLYKDVISHSFGGLKLVRPQRSWQLLTCRDKIPGYSHWVDQRCQKILFPCPCRGIWVKYTYRTTADGRGWRWVTIALKLVFSAKRRWTPLENPRFSRLGVERQTSSLTAEKHSRYEIYSRK